MDVTELSRDQLIELKEAYLTRWAEKNGERLSWGDLANADDEIPDQWVFDYYAGYTFTNDDFCCTAGQ